MARLPQIQSRGAITRGPQSSVSAAEIANPFEQIASGLDAWADTFQRKEMADAQDAGSNATYRDADGSLRVDTRSNLSATGRAYNAAAQQGYAARLAGDIRARGVALQNESKGNVDTFRAGWKAFRDQTLKAVPKEFRGAVTTMLDTEGPQIELGLSERKRRQDLGEFEKNIRAEIGLLSDDMSSLAISGGTATDAYKQKQAQVRTLYGQLVENPDFGVGDKEAEIEIKRLESNNMAQAFLGEADRALKTGGVAAAQKLVDKLMKDDTLSLSLSERRQYAGLVNQAIQGYGAERKANLQELEKEAKVRRSDWEKGIGLDDPADDRLFAAMARNGDFIRANELRMYREKQRAVKAYADLSPAERVTEAERAAVGGVESVVDQIIGVESGGRADAKNPLSSAEGLGQFIDSTWLATVQKHRPDIAAGRSRSELLAMKTDSSPEGKAFQREMLTRFTQENAEFLRNQGIQQTPGNIYLAHFLGQRGASQAIKADPSASVASVLGRDVVRANPFLAGKTVADLQAWANKKMGGGGATIDPSLVQEYREIETASLKESKDEWNRLLTSGEIPDRASLDILTRQLAISDDPALRQEYAEMFRKSEAYQQAFAANPEEASAIAGAMEDSKLDGVSLAEADIMAAYSSGARARDAALKADPLGYGVDTGAIPPVPQFDVAAPDTLGPTAQQMQRSVDVMQAGGQVSGISAFRPAQEKAYADMWRTASPEQLSGLTDAMTANLSPATLFATLSKGEAKAALVGAALSNDPMKHAEAMKQLDALSANSSMAELEGAFGKDVADRVQDWQGRVKYFTAEETADWLKQRNDPEWVKRVDPRIKKGEKEARTKSAADIVGMLDTNMIFDAAGPIDPDTERAMMNDFVTLTGERNASIDDADKAMTQAVERMRKTWGVTSVYGSRGGRLMPYPPEQFYPAIGNSHDYIGTQMQEIATARGVEMENMSLIADRKTQAAAQRGEQPGYLISIIDPETGMQDVAKDEQGRPLRYFFDPSAAQGEALSGAKAARSGYGPSAMQDRIRAAEEAKRIGIGAPQRW